jgi:hypothetical protein
MRRTPRIAFARRTINGHYQEDARRRAGDGRFRLMRSGQLQWPP